VLTNEDVLADKFRSMRNFCFAGYDRVTFLGTNAKLNEFSAAFAIRGLECLESLTHRNRQIRETYQDCLVGLPGVSFHLPATATSVNDHYAIVLIDPATCPLTRDELLQTLWAENIPRGDTSFPAVTGWSPTPAGPSIAGRCFRRQTMSPVGARPTGRLCCIFGRRTAYLPQNPSRHRTA